MTLFVTPKPLHIVLRNVAIPLIDMGVGVDTNRGKKNMGRRGVCVDHRDVGVRRA